MFKIFCLFFLVFSAPLSARTVSFIVEEATPSDSVLIEILQEQAVFAKLKDFSDKNLQLKLDISFTFVQKNNAFSPVNQNQINVPFSFLHQLYEDLQTKYPEQQDVIEKLFAGGVEKLLWVEFGRVLINQYSLAISGQEEFTLDNFSTIMLLSLNDDDSAYLLDATEEYLLINDSSSLLSRLTFQKEAEFDEERYRMVVCLVLGKDHVSHIELLKELAWDKQRLESCRELYQQKLTLWYEALEPYLAPGNILKTLLDPPTEEKQINNLD